MQLMPIGFLVNVVLLHIMYLSIWQKLRPRLYWETQDQYLRTAPGYGSAEGPPRVVENRNLLSHPDDLRKEAYVIRMT